MREAYGLPLCFEDILSENLPLFRDNITLFTAIEPEIIRGRSKKNAAL